MTCKDCIYKEACNQHLDEINNPKFTCAAFKDRSKFIELPNVDIEKINQPLTEALKKIKNAIDRVQKNISQTTVENALKEAILKATKEEAEQALKEREKE